MRQRGRFLIGRQRRFATMGRSAKAARLLTLQAARRRRESRRGLTIFGTFSIALIFLGVMFATALISGVLGSAVLWNVYSAELPDLNSVEARQFETTRIYDRHGVLLYEVNDPQTGYRTYSSYNDITQDESNMNLVNATIAAEDRTFWQNFGVDPLAIARGAVINLTGEGSSGGSTITQQLVRQLYPDTIGTERSIDRKIREAIVAVQFTYEYEKEEVIELYFNSVYYGNRAYGIDAAARSYFNKQPSELSLAEASLLAGLPQAPSAYDPTQNLGAAKSRQRYVLDQMVEAGYVTEETADEAWDEVLVIYPGDSQQMLAPHWVNYVISELEQQYGAELVYRGGLTIRTTLDYELQQQTEEALQNHVGDLSEFNANTGAVVSMLPGTGEIVSMVGSVDYWDDSISGQFNVATSERQPGSAFMPIVYASAFEQGWGPPQVMFDYPARYQTPGAPSPEFVPENTSGDFSGAVTAREALARSINIPAVQALEYAEIGPTIDLAHQIGIRTGLWRGLDFYGLALALGAGEVSPFELASSYATLANEGRYVPPNPVLEITRADGEAVYSLEDDEARTGGQQVVRPETAYLLSDILSDDEAREPAYGEGNALEFPELDGRPVAAKTGTSFDWFDNWTVGYSTDIVSAVWVGNAGNTPMESLSGIDGAAPIFHDIMVAAHDDEFSETLAGFDGETGSESFTRPQGIEEIDVCEATGGLPGTGDERYTEIIDRQSRPVTRCDQLTEWQWQELQKALGGFSEDNSRFTDEGVDSLLRFSETVSGGVGVPDDPIEPSPTPSPTPEPTPTPTATPQPTPRPTSTPMPSPTSTEEETDDDDDTDGDDEGAMEVPNLFGLTEAQAIAEVESAGLVVGEIFYVDQDDLPPGVDIDLVDVGEVLLQSPSAGSSATGSTEVTFAVRAE